MKSKYKYDVIVIHARNSSEIIDIQELLFSFGIGWLFNEYALRFKRDNEKIFCVYLIDCHISYLDNYDRALEYINRYEHPKDKYDKHIYTMDEIRTILSIIKYGKGLPSYKPKKRIERTLESNNIQYPYRFKTEKEMIKDYGENWREYSIDQFETPWDDYHSSSSEMDKFLGTVFPYMKYQLIPKSEDEMNDVIRNTYSIDDGETNWYIAWWMLTKNEMRKPSYKPKEKPKRLLESNNYKNYFNNISNKYTDYPYRFKTKEEFIKEFGEENWRDIVTYGFIPEMDGLLGKDYKYSVNKKILNDDLPNVYIRNVNLDVSISWDMLIPNLSPSYKPKEKPKRLLESKVTYPYRFKTEKEFIKDYGERWRNFLDNNGPNWSNSMDYLFGEVLPFTIDKFNDKDNYYASDYRYDSWIFSWYMLTPNIPIKPTYEPKKRTERTLEKLNEDYTFINDNEKLKRINFDYLIGDFVIIRYDALDLHLNNILWDEDLQVINFIKNNINKRFRVEKVVYCTDNHRYYLKIEIDKNFNMWIYSGAVKSIEPSYKPKEKPKRLLEEIIWNGESNFRVWCDTKEKSKEFEELLYKRGWKWDTSDGRRVAIESKMMFLFFMDRKKFDSYSGYAHDDLTVYNYPNDLNKIYIKFNLSPSYEPKGIKRSLDD